MQFVSDQQIQLAQTVANDTIDSLNRLTHLNLRTAQETMQFATASFQQLLAARESRDFFALAHQAQEGFERYLNYGKELFSLTTGLESRVRASAAEVPSLDSLVHAPAAPAASYPGQDEYPQPNGPAHGSMPPSQRDVQVRRAARNQ